jgi:hypothetical protein
MGIEAPLHRQELLAGANVVRTLLLKRNASHELDRK